MQRISTRIAALTLVGCFAIASLPLVAAQEEPSNGALDHVGDVYPTAWAATLPGTVEHAELLDLARFQVTHESLSSFVIELELGDLPDDWLLQEAPPGGTAVPAIVLPEGQSIPSFDVDQLDNRVQHSVFFTIDGKNYVAQVSLAELNLRNAQDFPKVNTTEYMLKVIDALQLELDDLRAQLMADENLTEVWNLPHKKSAEDAIALAQEKVDEAETTAVEFTSCPSSLQEAGACEESVLEGMRFNLSEQFDSARDHLEAASDAVDGLQPTVGAEVTAGFAAAMALIDGIVADIPAANLEGSGPAPSGAPAAPASPTAILFHRFALYRLDESANGTVLVELDQPGGIVDLEKNVVRATIGKDDVGAEKGMKLSEFRAEAAFKGVRVDYAPDAAVGNPGPTEILFGVAGQEVVAPAYGKDYEFSYETVDEDAPGLPVRVQLSPIGPANVEVAPGGSTTFYVTLKNVGSEALGGFFSLSPDGEGWVSQVSEPVWSLGAGSSSVFTVTVAGAADADAEKITRLTATVDGGESTHTDLRTTMKAQAEDDSPSGGGEKSAKKGRLPGFESVGLLAALAGLVVLVRRRAAP